MEAMKKLVITSLQTAIRTMRYNQVTEEDINSILEQAISEGIHEINWPTERREGEKR